VWAADRVWSDDRLLYSCAIGDVYPGHAGNELLAVGESSTAVLLYKEGTGWRHEVVFRDSWYITNVAYGDVDPAHPGNEIFTVGRSDRLSEIYWQDGSWHSRTLFQGEDWIYGVLVADLNASRDGMEVGITDDAGRFVVVYSDGSSELVWTDKDYIDVLITADMDPDIPGEEIYLAGGTGAITRIHQHNGTWSVKQVWKGGKSIIDLAFGNNSLFAADVGGNLTRVWNTPSGWQSERLFHDVDVLYAVEYGDIWSVPEGPELVASGWSGNITMMQWNGTWKTSRVHTGSSMVFGMCTGDVDAVNPGSELVFVDYSGGVSVLTRVLPGFRLIPDGTMYPAAPGDRIDVRVLVLPVGGFSGDVELTAAAPEGWGAAGTSCSSGSVCTVGVDVPPDAQNGEYSLTITGTSGTHSASADITVSVASEPADFSVTVVPSAVSIPADREAVFTVLTRSRGYSGTLSLRLYGAPQGADIEMPDSVQVGEDAYLRVHTISTNRGAYYMTLTAEGGGLTRMAFCTLYVDMPGAPDFEVSVLPGTLTLKLGETADFTLSVMSVNNYTGTVRVSFNAPESVNVSCPDITLEPTAAMSCTVSLVESIPDRVGITATASDDERSHSAVLLLVPCGPASIELSLNTTRLSVPAGSMGAVRAAVNTQNYSGSVSITVSWSYPHSVVQVNGSWEILLSAPEDALPGSYTAVVAARGTGIEDRAEVQVEVFRQLPLLSISGVDAPSRTVAGRHFTAVLHITCQGVSPAEAVVDVYTDGVLRGSVNASVQPGENSSVEYRMVLSEPGEHNLTFRLRPGDYRTGTDSASVIVHAAPPSDAAGSQLMLLLVLVLLAAAGCGVVKYRTKHRRRKVKGKK